MNQNANSIGSGRPRKKLYVNKMIQGRIIGRFALYWLLYHAVLWHTMFLYRYLQYREELLAGGQPVSFNELYGSFAVQNYSLVICALAVFPIIIWDLIRFTHRIAGPLVRFEKSLHRLAQGEFVEFMRLRDDDLLTNLRDAFNDFLKSAELVKPDDASNQTRTKKKRKRVPEATEKEERLLRHVQEFRNSMTRWEQDHPSPDTTSNKGEPPGVNPPTGQRSH